MQGKDTPNSTFLQLFEPISENCFEGADAYVKKLYAAKLFCLLAFAQLEQLKSLRDISNSLNSDLLSRSIGLESISHSQVSRRLGDIPSVHFQRAFRKAFRNASLGIGQGKVRNYLGRTHLIDSSTISLCLSKYRWAKFRKTKGGIKLHLRLRLWDQYSLPDLALVTTAKPNDKTQMDNLVVEEQGAINIFDRAYVDYGKFDRYCANGVIFISRLKSNAAVDVHEYFSLDRDSPIDSDCKVYLGAALKRMKHPLRIISTTDTKGEPVVIVTNDFEMSAEEVGDLYRCRWQIEIFFKWLKQNMHVKHMYGTGKNAVENQLYIALATYCLLMILKLKSGFDGSLLTMKRLLRICYYEAYDIFLNKLFKKRRSSRGRHRVDHEAAFKQTLQELTVDGDEYLEFMNDEALDPIIL